jgi:hypothetical protein
MKKLITALTAAALSQCAFAQSQMREASSTSPILELQGTVSGSGVNGKVPLRLTPLSPLPTSQPDQVKRYESIGIAIMADGKQIPVSKNSRNIFSDGLGSSE